MNLLNMERTSIKISIFPSYVNVNYELKKESKEDFNLIEEYEIKSIFPSIFFFIPLVVAVILLTLCVIFVFQDKANKTTYMLYFLVPSFVFLLLAVLISCLRNYRLMKNAKIFSNIDILRKKSNKDVEAGK